RFLEEAQVTGQLDHPGIVPVHELGIDARGRVFFTMKLVKGKTLEQVLDAVTRGADDWNVTRALSVVLRVCEAMEFAHEKGVIHRDLKPANIMVGRFGETYVMDWGLARVLGKKDTKDIRPRRQDSVSIVHTSRRESTGATPNSPLLTMDGDLVGTPVYMPPEQAHGDLERIDSRSDVYAVGAILYHLLSGQMPYVEPGTNPAPYTILDRVKAGPPTALHTLVKNAPAELIAICDKAMERDPDRRYTSMLDLADDLRAYLERRVVKAYETGAIAEMKKWVHRNKGLAAAAAIALITLAAGAALFVRNTSLKAANAEIASKNEQLARKQDEFNLVAARIKLGNAIAIEETLYPPWPHKIEAMEKWLDGEAAELLALKPLIERTIAVLENRKGPPRFVDQAEQFLHTALTEIVRDYPRFESEVELVRRRLAWARRIEELTLHHPNARVSWAAARDAIANADDVVASMRYRTNPVVLEPQLGLVPIGMNPVTKLWEFYELRSACDVVVGRDPASIEIPTHREDGSIEMRNDTGIVFVLLPGATFLQGAQNKDASAPGFDPMADGDESPQSVTLAPFFLARHELTNGQRYRLEEVVDPSAREISSRAHIASAPPAMEWIYPAEFATWGDCSTLLRHFGLALPTEAQWEYGARAGTTTPWWTGSNVESLLGAANIGSYRNEDGSLQDGNLGDGFDDLSPVGTFAASPYGIYDVHGNAWERCQDAYSVEYPEPRLGDGLRVRQFRRTSDDFGTHVLRGGNYDLSAWYARSAARDRDDVSYRSDAILGVRPARVLD
ncbi:MAG: SUMF1/EgtB/PvdO family nonheme iron enzyme, partial [Planctomycetes bacterium]|nr:SUMF1/EgtB/PvdO family nonheme iron enzyme [Planctomycetota bacterium]